MGVNFELGIIVEIDDTVLIRENFINAWKLSITKKCIGYIFSVWKIQKKMKWINFNKFVMTRIQILPELLYTLVMSELVIERKE